MYNKELKLNEKISIGLMNDYGVKTTIGLEFIRINGTLYFNDTNNQRHFTIKELIRDYILDDLRNDLNNSINKFSLSNKDLQVFFRHFLSTCQNMKIDLNDEKYQSFAILFDDIFNKFKDNLDYQFIYNFEQIFDGKIIIKRDNYGNDNTYLDLKYLKINDNKWLKDNEWYIMKRILMVIKYCSDFKDYNIYKMIKEFISLNNFLKGKKTITINGNKHCSPYVFSVLDKCKISNVSTIKHGYKKFTMNYLEEITHLMAV